MHNRIWHRVCPCFNPYRTYISRKNRRTDRSSNLEENGAGVIHNIRCEVRVINGSDFICETRIRTYKYNTIWHGLLSFFFKSFLRDIVYRAHRHIHFASFLIRLFNFFVRFSRKISKISISVQKWDIDYTNYSLTVCVCVFIKGMPMFVMTTVVYSSIKANKY